MDTNELYLKTLFCCSACDGEIAPKEMSLVKELSLNDSTFDGLDAEKILNAYVEKINEQGSLFLKNYLSEVANATLSDEQQIKLIEFAIRMIEADNQILYSEVKFFKKIRNRMGVSDESILAKLPNFEDYLLPDILVEEKDFEEVGKFLQNFFHRINIVSSQLLYSKDNHICWFGSVQALYIPAKPNQYLYRLGKRNLSRLTHHK